MKKRGHGPGNNQTRVEPDGDGDNDDSFGEQELQSRGNGNDTKDHRKKRRQKPKSDENGDNDNYNDNHNVIVNQNNAPSNTVPAITPDSTVAPAVTTEGPKQQKKRGPKGGPQKKKPPEYPVAHVTKSILDARRKFKKEARVTDQTLSSLRELTRLRQNACLDDDDDNHDPHRALEHHNNYMEVAIDKKIREALSTRDSSNRNGYEGGSGSIAESDSESSNNDDDDDDEGFDEHDSEPRTANSTAGLKDTAILELFSKQIKTGLPRGYGSDYKSILRNQLPKAKWYHKINSEDHVNIQDMCFQEKSPYRSVDYNRKITNTEEDLEDEDPHLTCPDCFGTIVDMNERREIHQKIIAEAKSKITELENTKRISAAPIMFQTRCHWCGIKLPDVINYSNLLSHARVDIEGVGSLPCIYEFDHEQKRLCLHCAAECGALLKEKRRFQRLYELSSVALPRGCNNCGLRESVEFRPSFDRTGETCFVCSEFKQHQGLDPDPPGFIESEAEFLSAALIENTDQAGIHWDRIANNPYANPQFEYTSHGLLNRWIHSRKTKDTSALSTYILLQHNHLTRRSQDWELYTCTARNPTQAALYFARFVSLYKKRPMTYLYIRQLEDWNIPEPRGDEWEDLSYGLQTFEQLKSRIRRSILQSSPDSSQSGSIEVGSSPTAEIGEKTVPSTELTDNVRDEMADDYEYARRTVGESVKRTLAAFKKGHDGSDYISKRVRFSRWESRMKSELGPENKEMTNQLHWDKAEDARDFREYRMMVRFIYSNVFEREDLFYNTLRLISKERLQKPLPSFRGFQSLCRVTRAELMLRKIPKLMGELTGRVQAIAGYVPLDPPEYESRDLPAWAQENARDVVQKTVADNRLLYIYHRHLQYLEYEAKKCSLEPDLDDEVTQRHKKLKYERAEEYEAEAEETAKRIYKLAQELGHAPRTYQDCLQLGQEIVYKDHEYFNRRSADFRRLASGDFILLSGRKKTYKPLINPLKMLRPNTLRTLAGPRPDLSDEKDPIQRLFLETITEVDHHRTLHSRPVAAVSRDIFYEDEFQGRPTFPKKGELPSPWDTRWNPSGEYPVYLLPPEYQVHVFQSVLTPESRTASIRLVRTERYKRQGDSVQGGGPVVLPKVIDKEAVRGFYRESNRTERYKPDRDDSEPIIVLRGKNKKGKHKEHKEPLSSHNGIEVRQGASSKDLDMLRGKKINGCRSEGKTDVNTRSESQAKTIQEIIQEQERLHRTPEALNELQWVEGEPFKVSYEPCLDETPILRMTQVVGNAIREARHWTDIGPTVYREGVRAGASHALGIVNRYPEKLAFSGGAAPKKATDLVWLAKKEQRASKNARNKQRTATLEEAEALMGEKEQAVDEEGESEDESEDEYDSEDSDAFVYEEEESKWLTKHRDDEERACKFAELISKERDNYLLLRQWLEKPPVSDWTENKTSGSDELVRVVAAAPRGPSKQKKDFQDKRKTPGSKGKGKGKGKAMDVSEEGQEEEREEEMSDD
ncbi:hypothetical protein BGX26_007437 [Mortierella sp. AD094]|nr:hypothetical protein BGX26_007437 [Mortierella sp. AD094]